MPIAYFGTRGQATVQYGVMVKYHQWFTRDRLTKLEPRSAMMLRLISDSGSRVKLYKSLY